MKYKKPNKVWISAKKRKQIRKIAEKVRHIDEIWSEVDDLQIYTSVSGNGEFVDLADVCKILAKKKHEVAQEVFHGTRNAIETPQQCN